MKTPPKDLEAKLQGQAAVELDDALLDRLEAAAEGSLTQISAEDLKFEAQLRAIQPQGLSETLLQNLEAKVEGLPAPSQVRILPFPGVRADREQTAARKQPVWAAAAAVAVLGVITAFLIDPMSDPDSGIADSQPTPPTEFSTPRAFVPAAVPAEFTRALSHTQDQGIIWDDNKEPHSVLKVTYTDRVSLKREDGSTYEVEKPRVEYYLVPTDSH